MLLPQLHRKERAPAMKIIADILGELQILLDIDFNLQDGFEEYLIGKQRTFLAILRVIEDKLPSEAYYPRARTGWPVYFMSPFLRAFLASGFQRWRT